MSDPLTGDCVRLLTGWSAPTPEQEELRRRFLDWAGTRPRPWARECPGAHLTASAAVVSPGGDRAALVRHRKVGRWLQLGGHVEPGDADLAAAARREVEEEAGVACRVDPVPVLLSAHPAPCGTADEHLDVQFLAVADPDAPLRPEADPVRWFAVDTLPEDLEPGVRALIARAASRLSRPPGPPDPAPDPPG